MSDAASRSKRKQRANMLKILSLAFTAISVAAFAYFNQHKLVQAIDQPADPASGTAAEARQADPAGLAAHGAERLRSDLTAEADGHASLTERQTEADPAGVIQDTSDHPTRLVLGQPFESANVIESKRADSKRKRHGKEGGKWRYADGSSRETNARAEEERAGTGERARERFRSFVTLGRAVSTDDQPEAGPSVEQEPPAPVAVEPASVVTLDEPAVEVVPERGEPVVIDPAPEVDPIEPDDPHILGWLNIGYTSNSASDRYIGQRLEQVGWRGVIERDVVPQLEWGARRVMVHNPFGIRDKTLAMPFDAYLEAQEDGLDWVTAGFVEAWRPVVEGAYTNGEPVEVIGYIGAISLDPEMIALMKAGDMEGWLARAEASIAPLLDAGMSVAFDAAALIDKDHPGYDFMLDVQDRGVTVYSEAFPRKIRPHLYQFRVIMLKAYDRFINTFPERFPMRHELAHRTTQLIHNHERDPDDPDWLVNKTLSTLVEGDNVMTNINWLIQQGYTQDDLLEQASIRRLGIYD